MHIAIDGNEANVENRVGSNVYAFEMLLALHRLLEKHPSHSITILLSSPPIASLPPASPRYHYRVIKPAKLWTQFALPLYLFSHFWQFDVFYTPSHYAPRFSPIPYISTVLDLAFLEFPAQFLPHDLKQLTSWTRYSVRRARKIAVISRFTAQEVTKHYSLPPEKIIPAPPGFSSPPPPLPPTAQKDILAQLYINAPFFLYLGTIQPRKNLIRLIDAFTAFMTTKKSKSDFNLVIAGKIGWLANEVLDAVSCSPFRDQITLTDFVDEPTKYTLLTNCLANYNLGLYEGFGIPALEALSVGALPVVANNTSLPEVIGQAGLAVDPLQDDDIADSMHKVIRLSPTQKKSFAAKAAIQLKKFSYEQSAQAILDNLASLTRHA